MHLRFTFTRFVRCLRDVMIQKLSESHKHCGQRVLVFYVLRGDLEQVSGYLVRCWDGGIFVGFSPVVIVVVVIGAGKKRRRLTGETSGSVDFISVNCF